MKHEANCQCMMCRARRENKASLAAPVGSESRLNAGGLYRKFKSHVRCVGLHLKETKSGIELRCCSRTHGGNDVLLMKIPNEKLTDLRETGGGAEIKHGS